MNKMNCWKTTLAGILGAVTLGVQAADVEIKPLRGQEVVRVCADAYNLPYSNKELEGFDNKIAEIIGEELGLPVEYYWFPQRMGFARNTINRPNPEGGGYMCDIAFNIPTKSDMYLTSDPYFRSIEGMVYRADDGYELNSMEDIAKVSKEVKPLRIGIFDRALTTKPLIDLGLREQLTYFNIQPGGVADNPGRTLIGSENSIASGDLDVVMIWGPIGSYYANTSTEVPMKFVPLNELTDRYVFEFSAGFRRADKRWRDVVNAIFEKRKDDIEAILAEYHLPSLDNVVPQSERRVRVFE
ncbi:quinoprotein dehydrogenase-associated putative ABC transporter substrate-binding protein [Methylophaga lonarensis]|uniref:quinoprotein dehydrogenase-associated putative ABC transporter substrate-binding protein n=2 Tax=Methylophaga lonarensis TaxID=999151 RepID=UPI003D2C6F73